MSSIAITIAVTALIAAACSSPDTATTSPAPTRGPDDPIAWTEYGPDSVLVARAISTESQCPELRVDGTAVGMRVRAAPDNEFPVLVCERDIAEDAGSAAIDGRPLALRPKSLDKIAIVGDTGCEIILPSGKFFVQACNDPDSYPAARISDQISRQDPDLIIHVGDYYYRWDECPANFAGCQGSPHGDNWPTWNADFFEPFSSSLPTAPWIFVRGNHETCDRGGAAWFRFLDPQPPPQTCTDFTPPYLVDVAGHEMAVVDVAEAGTDDNNFTTDPAPSLVESYRQQFAEVDRLTPDSDDTWLLSHAPIWALGISDEPFGLQVENKTLQPAWPDALSSRISIVLSGHVHWFGSLSFQLDRPAQLIAGNSGANLFPNVDRDLRGYVIDGLLVDTSTSIARFGFVTASPEDDRWRFTAIDPTGAMFATCDLAGQKLTCNPSS